MITIDPPGRPLTGGPLLIIWLSAATKSHLLWQLYETWNQHSLIPYKYYYYTYIILKKTYYYKEPVANRIKILLYRKDRKNKWKNVRQYIFGMQQFCYNNHIIICGQRRTTTIKIGLDSFVCSGSCIYYRSTIILIINNYVGRQRTYI